MSVERRLAEVSLNEWDTITRRLSEGTPLMRWLTVATAALIALTGFAAEPKTRTFTFARDDVGKLPRGWKADHTGKGEGSVWKVVADDTAPSKTGYALAQTAEGPEQFFNLCVAEDTRYTDLAISVSF